jgi:hypothetical protein
MASSSAQFSWPETMGITLADHDDCYQLLVKDLFMFDLPMGNWPVRAGETKELFTSGERPFTWGDENGPWHTYKVTVWVKNYTIATININFDEGIHEIYGRAISMAFRNRRNYKKYIVAKGETDVTKTVPILAGNSKKNIEVLVRLEGPLITKDGTLLNSASSEA